MSRIESLVQADAPQCLAMLVCERTIEERDTGIKSAICIFDGILLARFPGTFARVRAFVQITKGQRATEEFRLTVISPSGKTIVDPIHRFIANEWGETGIYTIIQAFDGLKLPEPGYYRFCVLHEDRIFAERRVLARLAPPA